MDGGRERGKGKGEWNGKYIGMGIFGEVERGKKGESQGSGKKGEMKSTCRERERNGNRRQREEEENRKRMGGEGDGKGKGEESEKRKGSVTLHVTL